MGEWSLRGAASYSDVLARPGSGSSGSGREGAVVGKETLLLVLLLLGRHLHVDLEETKLRFRRK